MRRVIVTGGSRGIGAGIVRRFRENGDAVAFLYRASDEAASALASETGAYAVRGDVADPADAKRALDEAKAKLGGVDVLVCSAGVASVGFFDGTDEAEWSRVMETNAGGVYRAIREVIPDMVRQKYGRIVTISSIWGVSGASMEGVYSASKAAVIGMTEAVARELAPSGITANAVAPGVIDTDMNRALPEETRESLIDEIPAGHFGTPGDVAAAVFFLASDEASYVTGQTLTVSGGF